MPPHRSAFTRAARRLFRLFGPAAVALCLCGAPQTAAAQSAASYAFAFNDAEIRQVAEEVLGVALGTSYEIDPTVEGRMSFRIDQRLTREQLLAAFEAALSAHDVVMVRSGNMLRLVPRARARQGAALGAEPSAAPGYQVVAAPLSYATPSEVAAALQSVGPSEIVVYSNDELGLLVLGGTAIEIDRAYEWIRLFDRSALSDSRIRWFELTNTSASDLTGELERLLPASGIDGVTIVPLRRLNGLMVFARTPRALDEVSEWVGRLDVPTRAEAASLWVYRPRNLAADSLAATLNAVLGLAAPVAQAAGGSDQADGGMVQAPGGALDPEDVVRVGVDTESNTLLISASAARWNQIRNILDEVDRTPDQILIEASILEVTLGDEFRLGVDWSAFAGAGLRVTSTGDDGGVIGSQFPGFSITYLGDDIRAAINVLGSRTNVEVISRPRLVVLDNRTASLQVGDQVPIVRQQSRSIEDPDSPLVVTTEYRNTGVLLDVTPRINGAGQILIDISQEVSSVARTTTSGIDSPTIQQRRLESVLILSDGGTVALGGLISTTRSQGRSGLPYVSDVPLLGALFRNDTADERRTELIVLLTARIIRDEATAQQALEYLMSDLREIYARGLVAP